MLSFVDSHEDLSSSSTSNKSAKNSESFPPTSGPPETSNGEQSSNSFNDLSSGSDGIIANSKSNSGLRAAEAFVRPTPVYTDGDLLEFGFDLKQCIFSLKLRSDSSSKQDAPTEIFLPDYHFPPDLTEVEVSHGKWMLKTKNTQLGAYHILEWWHPEGEHDLKVTGSLRQESFVTSSMNICRLSGCIIM